MRSWEKLNKALEEYRAELIECQSRHDVDRVENLLLD